MCNYNNKEYTHNQYKNNVKTKNEEVSKIHSAFRMHLIISDQLKTDCFKYNWLYKNPMVTTNL